MKTYATCRKFKECEFSISAESLFRSFPIFSTSTYELTFENLVLIMRTKTCHMFDREPYNYIINGKLETKTIRSIYLKGFLSYKLAVKYDQLYYHLSYV